MEFLKNRLVLPIVCILAASAAAAGPYDLKTPQDVALDQAKDRLCPSTEEFIKTLRFLRESEQFKFQEEVSRDIALKVSTGCAGASERFAQILTLLKTTGFSEKKSMEMALEFAMTTPDVQKNFLEIFSKSFLKEFFDYEFSKALKIAFELSKDYKGDPARAREDYIELARFCKNGETLGLSMAFCSDYSVQMARLSQFYPDGVSKPFMDLYKKLRESRKFGMNMKLALEIAYNVLKSGPKAPQNFYDAYDFATQDFRIDKKKALEFALKMANRSYVGDRPPVMQFPQKANVEP